MFPPGLVPAPHGFMQDTWLPVNDEVQPVLAERIEFDVIAPGAESTWLVYPFVGYSVSAPS